MKSFYTLSELAELLGARFEGEADYQIVGLATLEAAAPDQAAFLSNKAYARYLNTTRAGVVLLRPELASAFPGNKLLLDNPYLGFAHLTCLFDQRAIPPAGIHTSAVIGADCEIPESASIGPNTVLGARVVLGEGVIIGPGCYVGDGCYLGNGTELRANVTLYHGVDLGSDCLIHSGAVIGSDGFGFAPSAGQWHKIHQLGGVVIGDRVEIGACSTIDRGALDNTVIADGVKIDNLVQIAHNVRIGRNSAIAAHTAIAGSTSVGENCTIAGAVGIVGHVKITDNVHVTAMSMISSSISEPGSYSSGTPMSPTAEWRKNAVRFRQLDVLAARLRQLEKDNKQH